jgi:hypothetical protein
MRELHVCPPGKRNVGAVHRVQFSDSGGELVVWVEAKSNGPYGRFAGVTKGLYAYDIAAGTTRQLLTDDWFGYWDFGLKSPQVSPGLGYVFAESNIDDGETEGLITFEEVGKPHEYNHCLRTPAYGTGGLHFSASGTELIAVRNVIADRDFAPDVATSKLTQLLTPPKRTREQRHPFTGEIVRVRSVWLKWNSVVSLPHGERTCASALSADGLFMAVGTEDATVSVVDLKRKKVLVTLPWEGRKPRYSAVTPVALDPSAKWVLMIADRRLCARPLAEGRDWHTKVAFGQVNDFAIHPTGQFLCAVFEDGHARYIDPLTGAVRQSFRWGKKPLYSVAFPPDGLTCAAGGEKGQVVMWDVDA